VKQKIDGVLLLDKPVGPSSTTVLQSAKKLLGAKKAGHAGTLDPRASGLLPLLFGEATKFAQFGLDAPKEYLARIQLGVGTDTGDAEGSVTSESPVNVQDSRVAEVLGKFKGSILQTPPMHSALKHEGQPLYRLAREGHSVERAARKVEIHELELLGREKDALDVRVRCSKGTYVRQLAVDLGAALGTAAHLAALKRTRVGRLRIEDAVAFDALPALGPAALKPVDCLLEELPRLDLEAPQASRFLSGAALALAGPEGACRVYGQGDLLGVGTLQGGRLQPVRSIARG
jgi:tRNA pseudouridine55 synthase